MIVEKGKEKVILILFILFLMVLLQPSVAAGAQEGWVKSQNRWWYQEADGSYPASSWKAVQGKWYYFDQGGWMATGWQKVGGSWYYLSESGAMATGWQKIGGSWYYLSGSGAMATGWQKVGGSWYYLSGSGAMATGWQKIGGSWYYLSGSGAMLTGWQLIGGAWYYMYGDGRMAADTRVGDYYVNKSGVWVQESQPAASGGWVQSQNRWWYREANGSYPAGSWKQVSGEWYYFDKAGWMVTGWQKVNGTWYYLSGSGAMLTGWQQIGGSWYYLSGSGAMLTGWQQIGGSWYYLSGSGAMLTGWQKLGNSWYYLNADGKMAADTWIGEYYLDANGVWIEGKQSGTAQYTYAFPTASTKKGLQVNTDMMADVANLGVNHAVINITLNELLRSGDIPFTYEGTTYYLNQQYIDGLDRQIRGLHRQGSIITAVVLLQWENSLQDLILPGARTKGYNFYGWNTVESGPKMKIKAACTYLAKRYAAPDMGVVNWVASNEINLWKDYHYCGNVSFEEYMQYSTQEYRVLYDCVKSVYSNARIYLSIDHTWTYTGRDGSYPSKQVLDRFAALISQQGITDWNLAFHPYPYPEVDSAFWNLDGRVTMRQDSPIITMMNLKYLTDYVKNHFGADKRIILSECGFSSLTNGVTSEENQAAAIAYGYYLAEFNDMVDSFVVHRHVDHRDEVNMGFALGLWTNRAGALETADRKKKAYDVFRYMDTKQYQQYTNFILPMIGKKNWEEAVPGFNANRFS